MRISDWSSDVCSSDLEHAVGGNLAGGIQVEPDAGHHGVRPAHHLALHLRRPEVAVGEVGVAALPLVGAPGKRSEEHTSELQSLMRISYAIFCLKKKKTKNVKKNTSHEK